jgi:hypothetical protein
MAGADHSRAAHDAAARCDGVVERREPVSRSIRRLCHHARLEHATTPLRAPAHTVENRRSRPPVEGPV